MKILAPLLSGKEKAPEYIEAITNKIDKIILLQIVDQEFMNNTGAAMGEVMQMHSLLEEIKKEIGKKRKSCDEISEWGKTLNKIVSIALIQQVDKVVLVDQENKFFRDLVKGVKDNKINVELIKIIEVEENGKNKKRQR